MTCRVCGDATELTSAPVGRPDLRITVRCPACGPLDPQITCGHDQTYFDRTVCPDPCGQMHYCCTDCGALIDDCAWRRYE